MTSATMPPRSSRIAGDMVERLGESSGHMYWVSSSHTGLLAGPSDDAFIDTRNRSIASMGSSWNPVHESVFANTRTRKHSNGKIRALIPDAAGPSARELLSRSRSKRRIHERRAPTQPIEGSGGNDGVVLPMDLVGGGIYDVAYVISVAVGREENPRTFSLQVDTGSSDMWIAASSCKTQSCSRSGTLYNPSSSGADPTDATFSIDYLLGHVDGPVYWDKVTIGGYSIENQAVAAGTTVDDEPLSVNFNGILGLALPLNSVIAQSLPPVTTNDPDGAAWASNLFGITPVVNAPSLRFISMTLSRPGSDRVPSLLGIGRHPSFVSEPAESGKVEYSTLVADRTGTLFWKTSVRGITVYKDGERLPINLGRGVMGSVFPTAVLDSGVPLILTSSAIANGIYGALDVHPSADGYYYVPCNEPLNMTITLDNRAEIPLHPLDVTSEPEGDNNAPFCVGLIQAADAELGRPNAIGDMILGVPFLRNVYSVMAYAEPNADGTFPPLPTPPDPDSLTSTSTADMNSTSTASTRPTAVVDEAALLALAPTITPRLGLMSLTDPTVALDEFKKVRILNQPISTSTPTSSGGPNNPLAAEVGDGKKGMSVGIIVLVALVAFMAACVGLFGLRWWLMKRRYRKVGGTGANTPVGLGVGREGGGGGGEKGGKASSSMETEATLEMVSASLGGGGGYAAAQRMSKVSLMADNASVSSSRKKAPSNLAPVSSTPYSNQETSMRLPIDDSTFVEDDTAAASQTTLATIAGGGALMNKKNTKSASTLRTEGGFEEVWDPHDSMPMAWHAPTLMTKASQGTLTEDERERRRVRNDSSTLPLNGDFVTEGEGLELGDESIRSPPVSYDLPPPIPNSLPTRSYRHQRSAPSFPPRKSSTNRTESTSSMFHSPLPSSTIGDFGGVDIGGRRSGRNSKSVSSVAQGEGTGGADEVMMMVGVGTASRTKKIGVDGVFTGQIRGGQTVPVPRTSVGSALDEGDTVVVAPGTAY